MPLQQLTMNSDYSERPINPLPQKRNRNPPRAILVSSTRPTAKSVPQVNSFFRAKSAPNAKPFSQAKPFPQAKSIPPSSNDTLVPRSSTVSTHSRLTMGNGFHRQLKGFGPFDPKLKPFSKRRKFADFSAGEEVRMSREISIKNQSHQSSLEWANTNVTPLDCLPPGQSTLPLVGQPIIQNLEDRSTSSNPEFSRKIATSLQMPDNSESNAPVSNWSQAILSSCVVGAAAVAVVTGYACGTVIRGAMNVGQFIYANRENIQQTCTTCTQAVQSTYNAAKRRMVSAPRPRVGVYRRYTPSPRSQDRSNKRRLYWKYKTREQPSQPLNLVASTLPPDSMEGVEYGAGSHASPIAVSELFSEDHGESNSTCMKLEQGLFLPNKFVTFYESPSTGRPVDKSKEYIKDEPMDFPVDDSTLGSSAIIKPVENPTQIEQDARGAQAYRRIRDSSPNPPGGTTPSLALEVSGRRRGPRAEYLERKAERGIKGGL